MKKRYKVFLIILFIIMVGVGVLYGINNYLENKDDDREIVEVIKDPMGKRVEIIKDDNYVIMVDTRHYYKERDKLQEKAKRLSDKEIDKLKATDDEKAATKRVVKFLESAMVPDEFEIRDLLGKDYDDETIEYAMKHSGIDWDEQAFFDMLDSLAAGGKSKESLISSMKYKGYSDETIDKVINKRKIDYYEQALYVACYLRYTEKSNGNDCGKEEARKLVRERGFSKKETDYAVGVVYDKMKEKYD